MISYTSWFITFQLFQSENRNLEYHYSKKKKAEAKFLKLRFLEELYLGSSCIESRSQGRLKLSADRRAKCRKRKQLVILQRIPHYLTRSQYHGHASNSPRSCHLQPPTVLLHTSTCASHGRLQSPQEKHSRLHGKIIKIFHI